MSDAPKGGRYFGPARFFLAGDRVLAQRHISEARMLLGYMRDQHALGGPVYQVQQLTLTDGTTIRGIMNNGLFQAEVVSPFGGKAIIRNYSYLVGFMPFASQVGNENSEMDYIYRFQTLENVSPGTFISEVGQNGLAVGNNVQLLGDPVQAVSSFMQIVGSNVAMTRTGFGLKIWTYQDVYSRSRVTLPRPLSGQQTVAVAEVRGWVISIAASADYEYAYAARRDGSWYLLGIAAVAHGFTVGVIQNTYTYMLDNIPAANSPYSRYTFNESGTKAVRALYQGGYARVATWTIDWLDDAPASVGFVLAAPPAEVVTETIENLSTYTLTWNVDTADYAEYQHATGQGSAVTNVQQLLDVDFVDGSDDLLVYLIHTGTNTYSMLPGTDAAADRTYAFQVYAVHDVAVTVIAKHTMVSTYQLVTTTIEDTFSRETLCSAVDTVYDANGGYTATGGTVEVQIVPIVKQVNSTHVGTVTTLPWWDLREKRFVSVTRQISVTASISGTQDDVIWVDNPEQVISYPYTEDAMPTTVRLHTREQVRTVASVTCKGALYTSTYNMVVPSPNLAIIGYSPHVGAGLYAPTYYARTLGFSPVLASCTFDDSDNCILSYAYAPATTDDPEITNDVIMLVPSESEDYRVVRAEQKALGTQYYGGRMYFIDPTYLTGLV